MGLKKLIFLKRIFLILCILSSFSKADTILEDGDIAFTRINIDNESFSFVFLANISNGTIFYITDESYDGSGFSSLESTIRFTANRDIFAGEEVHISSQDMLMTTTSSNTLGTIQSVGAVNPFSGNMLGAAGDNLFIYQGSVGSPTSIIAGINANTGISGTSGNAWSTTTSTSNTLIPNGKSNGQNGFIGLFPYSLNSEVDNARYKDDSVRTGDKATILSNLMDYTKWEFDNTTSFSASLETFTVSGLNNAPTILNATASQTVNDNGTISPFSGIILSDTDGDNLAVTIALDDNTKGTLSSTSISSTSVSAAQTALRAITFNPTDNRVAPGSTETTTFTITVNDGTANSTPNNTTTVISTSVNDAPTNITLSSASVNQSGGANATVGTISSTDADTGDTATYTLVAGSGDTHNGIFTIATSCALGGSCTSTLRANDPSVLNAGTYSIRLNVNDGDEDFAKAFTITLIDDVSPTLSSLSTSNITVNTIDLKATSNETGVMYFSISTTSSSPTANDILTNKVSNSIHWNYRDVSANVEKIYSVSGLSANTKYYYYIMSKDTTGSSVINTSIISNGSFTTKALDTDSTLTGGTSIDESSMISIPTTVKTLASKVNVFDFKITDLGTGDALSTDIEQIDIAVSGTAVSNASKITWILNGPNVTDKVGTVSNNTITFSSLSSSISDGGNGTYTLSAYWNNPTGLTDNQTFGLTLTNLNIGVNTDKSTLASNQSVTNNTNAKVDVTATKLIFSIQPSNVGAI